MERKKIVWIKSAFRMRGGLAFGNKAGSVNLVRNSCPLNYAFGRVAGDKTQGLGRVKRSIIELNPSTLSFSQGLNVYFRLPSSL